MKGPTFNRGDAYLLMTTAIWGLNFPVAKAVLGVLDPYAFAGMRWIVATVALAVIVLIRTRDLLVPWRDFLVMAALGSLGVAVFQTIWTNGLAHTTAAKGSILVSTTPIFAALGGALIGRAPGLRAWAGAALGFGGVFLLVNNSLSEITVGGGSLKGDLMMLAVAALWAVYSAGAAPVIARHGALKTTFWIIIVGSICLVLIALPEMAATDWGALGFRTWSELLYTAIFSAALGFVWWYEGIRHLGPVRAMLYSYLIPVFGVAASAALLGDVMSGVQLLGAALALAGVALARRN